MKRLVTAERVAAEFAAGQTRIAAPARDCIVTPEAWSQAAALGVTIDQALDQGGCERSSDPSGVKVVRGSSVRLGRFAAAGENRNVGLLDLITSKDGAPMTAGIMSWSAEDSFPWKLDYDEIDLVMEGVLHLTIDGRSIEAKEGDVVYIPKGSSVIFATPHHVKVYYVTYPADWATA